MVETGPGRNGRKALEKKRRKKTKHGGEGEGGQKGE